MMQVLIAVSLQPPRATFNDGLKEHTVDLDPEDALRLKAQLERDRPRSPPIKQDKKQD